MEDEKRWCPVYESQIDEDLCYESLMCLSGMFKVSSVNELDSISDIEAARNLCKNCKYSKL